MEGYRFQVLNKVEHFSPCNRPLFPFLSRWLDLMASYRNPQFRQAFQDGHTNGFHLYYHGALEGQSEHSNHQSANRMLSHLVANAHAEVALGRVLGPFETIPFRNYRISPMGVVPKKYTDPPKYRNVHDLSWPPGDSFNDGIDKAEVSYSMDTIRNAIDIVADQPVFFFKFDLEAAFRIIPVHPSYWPQLGFKLGPYHFFDMHAPFGSRSSPFLLFEFVASPFAHILRDSYGVTHIAVYVDDFLVMHPQRQVVVSCHQRIAEVATHLGLPLHPDKYSPVSTAIEFVGFIIDSVKREVRLSPERLDKRHQILDKSLVGSLSHAALVVQYGRLFAQRLRDRLHRFPRHRSFVNLTREERKDIQWW